MITLGIESTCDETGFALLKNNTTILSNLIASQISDHQPFGGVVPELASRKHLEVSIPLLKEALKEADTELQGIDLIAVAMGPGLIGPLKIGINLAKGLALALNKPLIGVNHIEAHLYAALMDENQSVAFPAIGVVLSGGHTSLILMEQLGKYTQIGTTIDDAIGECFDKVASMLGLPYPGGPEIEKLAKQAKLKEENRFSFKGGNVKGLPLSFSFSGLKTAVLYATKGVGKTKHDPLTITEEEKAEVAYTFEQAAFCDVIRKLKKAIVQTGAKSLIFGGGVTQNKTLRKMIDEQLDLPAYWPLPGMSIDNAAMIAGLGKIKWEGTLKPYTTPWDLQPLTRIPLN